jgi:hypothetical protein
VGTVLWSKRNTRNDRTVAQSRALIHAIEALDAVTPETWFEQIVVALVRIIHLQRLRRLAGTIPRWAMRWVTDERGREPLPMVIGGWW